ncbi:MAG: hemerythrin domain-containing protein [Deltaproteobacteria bacterium]|nr:hemerythrin domain-containing protein [Deltaproteobacteria bacterium]
MLRRYQRLSEARTAALAEEWEALHGKLHEHHHVEDTAMFPGMRAQGGELTAVLDSLEADHRRIDPLLERGDRAFAHLPQRLDDARQVIAELASLLAPHLALEEEKVMPFLRGATEFPPPASEAEAELYASGFAWSTQGVASDIVEKLDGLLPESVRRRLPAARAAFHARAEAAFGPITPGSARTPIPSGD